VHQEARTKAEAMNMHGLPTAVASMLEALPDGVCGRCTSYDPEAGMCGERQLLVAARDVACEMYVSRRQ